MTDQRTFDPATLTIEVGDFVAWTNEGNEPHTVTAYEDSIPDTGAYFSSTKEVLTASKKEGEELARSMVAQGLLTKGQGFSVSFSVPGTYEYFCIPHEDQGMKGTIIVEPSG